MLNVLLLAAAASAASPTDNPGNVVRCVRESITGRMAATRRVCHTVDEWARIRRDSAEEANRVVMPQGRPSAGPGGG